MFSILNLLIHNPNFLIGKVHLRCFAIIIKLYNPFSCLMMSAILGTISHQHKVLQLLADYWVEFCCLHCLHHYPYPLFFSYFLAVALQNQYLQNADIYQGSIRCIFVMDILLLFFFSQQLVSVDLQLDFCMLF